MGGHPMASMKYVLCVRNILEILVIARQMRCDEFSRCDFLVACGGGVNLNLTRPAAHSRDCASTVDERAHLNFAYACVYDIYVHICLTTCVLRVRSDCQCARMISIYQRAPKDM